MKAPTPAAKAKPPKVWRKRLLVLAFAAFGALVAGELCLRAIVLTSLGTKFRFLGRICDQSAWGDHQRDDLYWVTYALGGNKEERLDTGGYHPILGWSTHTFDQASLRHVDEAQIGGRRPILMYGDSYTQCNTSPGECWQSLLQGSVLSPHAALLNYGVGGYGADQVLLLMQQTVDLYADQNPLLLVALMIDDDFDRAVLRFRSRPKPHFELQAGELVPTWSPVPTTREFFSWSGPLQHTSLLARLLEYQLPRHFPRWNQRRFLHDEQHKIELARAILTEMVEVARSRKLEIALVVFNHYPSLIDRSMTGWREGLVQDVARELGVACLVPRDAMLKEVERRGIDPATLYGGAPELEGHWNALGNQITFYALGQELARLLDLELKLQSAPFNVFMKAAPLVEEFVPHLRDSAAAVRFEREPLGPFVDAKDCPRLIARVGQEGPVEVSWAVSGRAKGLHCYVQFFPLQGVPPSGRAGLELFADGKSLRRVDLARGSAPLEVEVEWSACQELRMVIDDGGDGNQGDWVVLTQPRFL